MAKRDNQADGLLVSAVFLLAFPWHSLQSDAAAALHRGHGAECAHLPSAAAAGRCGRGRHLLPRIYWTFGFLRMGTTGLVAQAHGAQQHDQLRLHFFRALLSAVRNWLPGFWSCRGR